MVWPAHHEGTPHGTLHVRGGEGMGVSHYMWWEMGRGWEDHTTTCEGCMGRRWEDHPIHVRDGLGMGGPHYTCERWGGNGRSDQYSACTSSLVSPVSCRFFLMYLINKPDRIHWTGMGSAGIMRGWWEVVNLFDNAWWLHLWRCPFIQESCWESIWHICMHVKCMTTTA